MGKPKISEIIKQTYENLKFLSDVMGKSDIMTKKDIETIKTISLDFKSFINTNLEQDPSADKEEGPKAPKELPADIGKEKVKQTL